MGMLESLKERTARAVVPEFASAVDAEKALRLKAGDVVVLPGGTGHQRLAGSKDLLVVGAYPPFGRYDECRSSAAEHDRALATIPKVALPRRDPVYGRGGPPTRLWPRT